MKWINGKVEQASNDAKTTVELSTSLGIIDQRTIWEILGIQAMWRNPNVTTAGGFSVELILHATDVDTVFGDMTEIARIDWYVWPYASGAASAQSNTTLPLERIKQSELLAPFQFANSKLYLTLITGLTGKMNEVAYKLFYEEKKVSELDFLRIQAGYCVC